MKVSIWPAAWLSLKVAGAATLFAVLLAVPLAQLNARKRYLGKSVIEAIMVLPMVLPPTVVGYLIIMAMGARGWLGRHLNEWFDYSILFRIEGAILAAAIVALPLVYLPARAAFLSIEREMEDTARLMGASRLQLFWHISLPIAARGTVSGIMLAFARALGEFGATVIVLGIRADNTTLPVSIYLNYEQGEMNLALPAVVLLFVISITITYFYNRSFLGRQD